MGRYFRNCWAEKYRRNKNVALYPVRYDNRELILWRQCECSVINVCQKHHQVKSCRLYSLLKKCCSRCNLSLEKQCCRGISTPSLLPADSLLCSWLLLEADRLDSFRPSLGCALQQLSFQRNLVGCECDQVPSRQPCPAGAFSLAAGTTGRHPSGYSENSLESLGYGGFALLCSTQIHAFAVGWEQLRFPNEEFLWEVWSVCLGSTRLNFS